MKGRLCIVLGVAIMVVAFSYPDNPPNHAASPVTDSSTIARQFLSMPTPALESKAPGFLPPTCDSAKASTCTGLEGGSCLCEDAGKACDCKDRVTVTPLREADLITLKQIGKPTITNVSMQSDYVPIEITAPNVVARKVFSDDGKQLLKIVIESAPNSPTMVTPNPTPSAPAVAQTARPSPAQVNAQAQTYYQPNYVNYQYQQQQRRGLFSRRGGGSCSGGSCSSCR